MHKSVFFLLLSFLTLPLSAADSQVKFTAEVVSVNLISADEADLTVALTATFELPVRVTGETLITDEDDDPLSLSDLEVGMMLRIDGLYADAGILALEIEVVDSGSQVRIRGPIEAIDADDRTITVLGFVISVPETADIRDGRNRPLTFDELEVGQSARVRADFVEDTLVASEVKVRAQRDGDDDTEEGDEDGVRIVFRGIVVSVGDSELLVLIEGVGESLVRLTPETDIKGELVEGALVQIIGVVLEDLTVEARKVLVKRLLQLAPGRLKMRVDQTRSAQVILRNPLDVEVTLAVTSLDPTIAEVLTESVTIAAGKVVGRLEVRGAAEGETTVEVMVPAELGGLVAELEVQVRGAAPDSDDGDRMDPRLNWAPGTLNTSTGTMAEARLKINRPAEVDLAVTLELVEGESSLLEFESPVVIPAGEKVAIVQFTIGAEAGEARVRATLPEDAGGDSADLKIKIKEK